MSESVCKVYGLEINPFSAGGSFPLGNYYERKIALAFAGRDEAERIISQSLHKLSRGEGFPVIAICGHYGYGKTHALRYIYWMTREKYDDILSIYVKGLDSPSGRELYSKIIEIFLNRLGDAWLISVIDKTLKEIKRRPDIEEQFRNLFSDLIRVLPKIKDKDLLAIKWFLGRDLSFEELSKIGVYRNIDENNASKALSAFAFMIYIGARKKLLILIDELDKIIAESPIEELVKFYDFLRDVVDHAHGYYSLVLALPMIAISGERSIQTLHPALHSRIRSGGFYILLKELNEQSAIKIVTKYLKLFRKSDAQSVLDDLYPFTEEAIKRAVVLTKGYPRDFITLLHKAIEMGLNRGWGEINVDRINVVYEELEKLKPKEQLKEQKSVIEEIIRAEQMDWRTLRKQELESQYRERVRDILARNQCLAWSKLRDQLKLSESDLEILIEALEDLVEVIKIGKGKRVCLKV